MSKILDEESAARVELDSESTKVGKDHRRVFDVEDSDSKSDEVASNGRVESMLGGEGCFVGSVDVWREKEDASF